jgi:hypothetical protein
VDPSATPSDLVLLDFSGIAEFAIIVRGWSLPTYRD